MENYQQMGETAFQNEMSNGAEPGAAMDTAVEAVGGQMAEDGFPANIIEAATTVAVEDFNEVIEQGGEPGDAYSSAFEAGAAGGQEALGDDMPDLDAIGIEAFSAAVEGGTTPAEAAEAPAPKAELATPVAKASADTVALNVGWTGKSGGKGKGGGGG